MPVLHIPAAVLIQHVSAVPFFLEDDFSLFVGDGDRRFEIHGLSSLSVTVTLSIGKKSGHCKQQAKINYVK